MVCEHITTPTPHWRFSRVRLLVRSTIPRPAISALDQFKPDDLVGLRIFSTGISSRSPTDYLDVVPIGPIAGQKEVLGRDAA